MAVPIVKRAGARNVVITDINPARLAMAKAAGADAAIDVRTESISDIFVKLGIVEGFDIGLEMSGAPQAFSDMVDNMANGGKIAVLGIFGKPPQIDWNKVIFNSLTLMGIYGRRMYDTWYKMSALLKTGLASDVYPIITHTLPADNFQKGFDLMASGEACKVVLDWS
ncbi:MAG: zinc-binding dehydrogenase, partial [Defluviitaleaceae bacterium]|nr:zinc-binding dehydrogenase [Defluviitaleaceae bacterium]